MLAGDPTLPCKNWSVLGGIFDHRRSSVRPHGKAFVFGSGDGDEEYCTSSGWSLSPVSNANIIIARGTFTIIDGLTIIHKQGVDGEVAYCDAMDFALREAASKLLPMIVCNPDKVRPDICLSPMPGAIGDAYEAMLRKYLDIGKSKTLVKRVGKPYNEVFEVALNRIRGSQAIDDILSGCCMVGDAFETDIKGGLTVGCSTVWVVNNGIHGPSFEEMKVGDNWTQFNYENNCAKLVDEFNSSIHSEVGEWKHEIIPDFVIPSFQF